MEGFVWSASLIHLLTIGTDDDDIDRQAYGIMGWEITSRKRYIRTNLTQFR